MDSFVCPKGHTSTEPDYCSECGAKIDADASPVVAAATSASLPSGEVCPDCGTVREQSGIAFCEVCGYNFSTGVHGELPMPATVPSTPTAPPPATPAEAIAPANATHWAVTLSVDPSLRQDVSPEAPAGFAPVTITLDKPR